MEGIYGDPAFEAQRKALLPLLNDALSSYPAALAVTMRYSDSTGGPESLELLKRYRIFTRAVCDFARDVWPDVKLDWLYQQT